MTVVVLSIYSVLTIWCLWLVWYDEPQSSKIYFILLFSLVIVLYTKKARGYISMREAGRHVAPPNEFLSSPELNARAICNMVICIQSALGFFARCCYCWSVVCTCSLISALSFIFVWPFVFWNLVSAHEANSRSLWVFSGA